MGAHVCCHFNGEASEHQRAATMHSHERKRYERTKVLFSYHRKCFNHAIEKRAFFAYLRVNQKSEEFRWKLLKGIGHGGVGN
ncbi:hypothetical protein Nepgr_015124 [Nepenthes gracilis]|uniref:Uncharacterized protein n=1 Tax=Nepenthes gracilis TaxID=150966 RepID=A0AAD3SL81_NEPGR|nr:hypothetical protein Nepgr_015124 [Nepenthes gracilis]